MRQERQTMLATYDASMLQSQNTDDRSIVRDILEKRTGTYREKDR